MIIDIMRQTSTFDAPFNTQLAAIERGPWFRIIAAGFK
jgi:hypothetical protein